MPHVFSEDMFLDQAEFVSQSIKLRMTGKMHAGKKFTIVAHSIGCLTALLIEDEINKNGQLANIVCMGSPLEESPMKLNSGMTKII